MVGILAKAVARMRREFRVPGILTRYKIVYLDTILIVL